VGSAAQIKAMKQVAGKIKGDLAQYRELAAFAQFGSDLDAKTKATLDRGARIVELFKQSQYNPIAVEMQAIVLWAMQKGLFDPIAVDKVKAAQSKFVEFIETRKASILEKVGKKRMFDEEVEKELKAALEEFKSFNTL
jgi:F-type H+-transporting ATPase subunit alpha